MMQGRARAKCQVKTSSCRYTEMMVVRSQEACLDSFIVHNKNIKIEDHDNFMDHLLV